MGLCPSLEGDSHLVCQGFTCFLWNSKVHYRVHNSSSLDSILSQVSPVHVLTPYFF